MDIYISDSRDGETYNAMCYLHDFGKSVTPYFSHFNDFIEISDIVEIPYKSIENGGLDANLLAFKMVWWFEMLKEVLTELCVPSEEVRIEFNAQRNILYSIVLNTKLLDEAKKTQSEIQSTVDKRLIQKVKLMDKTHYVTNIGIYED